MKTYYQVEDDNSDGFNDCIVVYSKDFNLPLIGDYRGVRLAVIPYSNDEGKQLAEGLARLYTAALEKYNPGCLSVDCSSPGGERGQAVPP